MHIVSSTSFFRKSANRNGKLKRYDPNNDVEFSNSGNGGAMSERQVTDSTCPLLDGVVNTPWGAVSAGNVIAGIAAGAQTQQVNIMELVRASNFNYRNVQQTVLPIFPATLSGESWFSKLTFFFNVKEPCWVRLQTKKNQIKERNTYSQTRDNYYLWAKQIPICGDQTRARNSQSYSHCAKRAI